jgi:hypothetical protein
MATFSHTESMTNTDVSVETTLTQGTDGYYTRQVTAVTSSMISPEVDSDLQMYKLGVPVSGLFSFEGNVASVAYNMS